MSERWVWWVKRDLRVHDNAALRHVVDNEDECLAVFVFEPSVGAAAETSEFHALAQADGLQELNTQVTQRGGHLRVCYGEVVDVLETLYQKNRFTGLVSHEETGTELTFSRDKAVARWAKKRGVQWLEFPQTGVIRGLRSRDERQHIIFQRVWDTPIQRAPRKIKPWAELPDTHTLNPIELTPSALKAWSADNSATLTPSDTQHFVMGRQCVNESSARATLDDFVNERGIGYSGGISSPNKAFTNGSRLSAHLAWGTISLRTVFHETSNRMGHLKDDKSREAIQWKKSLRAQQARLHWHDHFIQRLESEPSMEFTALNPAYADVQYLPAGEEQAQRLHAWRHGQTGIPLLDACMRCMMTTGFLNFRMRAMVTTTACFGLQLHWKELLHPLAQLFADYEPGIHISQIQMQAGMVGINTLRVYSPHKQLLDQDPEATFVRRWIPELKDFSAAEIAQYETMSLGDYPRPVADIKANAKAIKDQLYAIRRSAEGKEAAKTTLTLHGSRLSPNDRVGSPRRRTKKVSAKGNDAQLSFDW